MKSLWTFLFLTVVSVSVTAANISGKWNAEFNTEIGVQKYVFTFVQDGEKLVGKANSEIGETKNETELIEGKVSGDMVSFVELLTFQGNELRIGYEGKVEGNEINFTRRVGDFATEKLIAKLEPGSAPAQAPARRGGGERRVWWSDCVRA
ncbi:MAG: hypothetical protein O2964_01560 [Verrucomicrobia bacterium]|nr:hypothetical protein [Verrucomicrobiota bacterium]